MYKTNVRVRYGETDQMGVVYYANYLTWFEVARTEAFREAGFSYAKYEEAGILLPVTEAHCRYLSSARYDDLLTIVTRVTRLTPVRLEFTYEIWRGETIVATGDTKHAFVGRDGRPVNLKKLGFYEEVERFAVASLGKDASNKIEQTSGKG